MKNLKITVNGLTYNVQVEEDEIQSSNSGASQNLDFKNFNNQEPISNSPKPQNLKSITAPMPGTIVSFSVKENQKINSGDVLLILEAMKMENEIMAPENMEIAKINVERGDSVETGQELILYRSV